MQKLTTVIFSKTSKNPLKTINTTQLSLYTIMQIALKLRPIIIQGLKYIYINSMITF